MDICSIEPEIAGSLPDRMTTYLSDRSNQTLAGPRRMGRSRLVEVLADHAEGLGHSVMIVPGESVQDPDVIIFDHWEGIDEALVSAYPDADVFYGQDLCHQVPAVVRLERTF